MTVTELANLISEELQCNGSVSSIVRFQNNKYMQICMIDGSIFNLAIVKTQEKIKRQDTICRRSAK